jgi:hypothetical protein
MPWIARRRPVSILLGTVPLMSEDIGSLERLGAPSEWFVRAIEAIYAAAATPSAWAAALTKLILR